MPESKPVKPEKPQIPDQILAAYTSAESRVTGIPPRRFILLIVGLGVVFILLGGLVGFLLSPYTQTPTPDNGLTTDGNGQSAEYSGIVRRLSPAVDGVEFYLETQDVSVDTRILLQSSQIDLEFFESKAITAEGVLVGDEGPGDKILFVSKIRIK